MMPMNPTPFLKHLIGKEIVVRLKWGMEYVGVLACADAYMNLQMANTEEFIQGESQGEISELLIRCNNILYIRQKGTERESKSKRS